MFNKKLEDRIKALELELRSNANDKNTILEKCSGALNDLEKVNKLVEEKERRIEQLTKELDILKNEREEIRKKCESTVDKDALLQLCMMKNHDLEIQINELNARLSDSFAANSAFLATQSMLIQNRCYTYYPSIF